MPANKRAGGPAPDAARHPALDQKLPGGIATKVQGDGVGKFDPGKIGQAISDISDIVDDAKPVIAQFGGGQTTGTIVDAGGYQPPGGLPFQPSRAVAGSYRTPGQVPGNTSLPGKDIATAPTAGGMTDAYWRGVAYLKDNPGKAAAGVGIVGVGLAFIRKLQK